MLEELSSMVENTPTGDQPPTILKEGGAMGLEDAAATPLVKVKPETLDDARPLVQEEETNAAIVTVSMPDPKPDQADAQEEGLKDEE